MKSNNKFNSFLYRLNWGIKSVAVFVMIMSLQNCSSQVQFAPPTANNNAASLPPGNNIIPPLLCSAGQPTGSNINYYPTACLLTPTNVASNSMGVEINNADQLTQKVFSIAANDPVNGVPSGQSLYVELATYVAPDTIVLSAIDQQGNSTQLLNICNVSTYTQNDPTNGIVRPYSDTILQFNVALPAGTVKLQFDFTGSTTPTYVGVWNLNSFSQSLSTSNPFPAAQANQFRVQNAALKQYNDNKDPLQPQPACPTN